jgi:hypothetical protein
LATYRQQWEGWKAASRNVSTSENGKHSAAATGKVAA